MNGKSAAITIAVTAAASVVGSVAYEFYVRPWLAARMGNSNGGQ